MDTENYLLEAYFEVERSEGGSKAVEVSGCQGSVYQPEHDPRALSVLSFLEGLLLDRQISKTY